MIPGTSCLATIVLSLRDKTIRPSKRLAIILALMGTDAQGLFKSFLARHELVAAGFG